MLPKEKKMSVISKFARNDKDVGSAEVQIAVLTEKINALNEHLKLHKKDHHSKRGLIKSIGKRRKMQVYLKKTKPLVYQNLIKSLSLRK